MAAQIHQPGDDPLIVAGVPSDHIAAAAEPAPPAPSLLLPAPPEAPKRQRRPSVRLGEIGDQPATLSYEPHPVPRRGKPQHSWRAIREAASAGAKSVKARSLVHLVNGEEPEGGEFGQRKKARRGPTTKRARSSSWVSSKVEELGGEEEEEEVGFREFDSDSDSLAKLQESPLPSFDNENGDDDHHHNLGGWRPGSGRAGGEGVRSWLIELGLSRYAPVFEVHEVDDEVLPLLTLEDLKDMGITAVGSRRKMFSAIQKLRRGYS